MNNTIKDFKNGLGYIYVTEADGTTFVKVYPNNADGGLSAQRFVYLSAPLAGNISSTGLFSLTSGSGTITSITVNGVNILGSTATGASLALLAADAVNKINSFTSSPDYTAVVNGNNIIIQALPSAGAGPNSFVVSGAVTGTIAFTAMNMSGGTNTQGLIDTSYGYRAFLNADYDADGCSGQGTASPTSLTNSIEITKYLVNRGFQTSFIEANEIISNGGIEVDRQSSMTILYVDTQALAASDDLDSISVGSFNENDLVIIRGENSARIVTVKDGTGNINLANNEDFVSGDSTKVLMLRLINGAWYEECRAPFNAISINYLRSLNIAIPVQGVDTTTLPTNGTITLTPGTDKQYQVYDGAPTLIGSVVIDGGGTPLDGDEFWIKYEATPIVGVNTVTIFGITLTQTQAESGLITIYAKYDLVNTVWKATIIQEANGVDFVTTASPYSRVLYNTLLNASNTGVAGQEVLGTYTMPANTFANDGSCVKVTAVYTTAANANSKKFYIYFGLSQVAVLEQAVNNNEVILQAEIGRDTSSSQFAFGSGVATGFSINTVYLTPSEALTAPVSIEARVDSPGFIANDMILKYMRVEYLAKP